ncbi:MAG: ATP-dependent acyl-CoA ligase [Sphingomonas sp.]|nr:MAG: ATP-dependent acyl-CoA ligase [Sphingomonas sp.]
MRDDSAHSGSIQPFTGRDLPWLLAAQAARRTAHPFLIYCPREGAVQRWTYGAFADVVSRLAGGLAALGIGKGEPVLIHMDNCIEFLLAWHACARLGALAVTTSTRSSADELGWMISHSGAATVISEPRFADMVRAAAPHVGRLILTATDAGEAEPRPRADAALAFEAVAAGDGALAPLRPPEPMLANSVQYTSGTTARPKGVVWTHANALWGARACATALQLEPSDIGHTCLPLFHTNALCYSHLATLWAGATLVFQPRFSASRYWSCVADNGCTWGVQIPFIVNVLRDRPVPAHNVHWWGLGAIDPPAFPEPLGIPQMGWYGMTETVGHPIVSNRQLPGRIGSMGTVAPGYEIEVRGDDGKPVPFGQSGMMWIKGVPGVSLFQCYLNNPEATAAAFDADGWFETGDRVTPHADGHIMFDGRARDMLRVGGENVAESEIERVLLATGLAVEAAVVGKRHPMLDEVPVAFVIPTASAGDPREALLTACRERLSAFKVPHDIRLVTELPRVTLGKIDKKQLRYDVPRQHLWHRFEVVN